MDDVYSKLKGRKLMLCDILYQPPSKITNWDDYLNIIYRDLITNKKEKLTIKNPTIDIYEVKEEFRTFGELQQRHYIPIEQCIVHTIKYKDRFKEIAKIAGPKWTKFLQQNPHDKSQLMKYAYVVGADIPIDVIYRKKWVDELGNDERKIPTKIFLDIEVNQKHWDGPIPRHGECPVDLVSIVDEETDTVHTFCLHVNDNPLIDDFIQRQDEVQKKLHELFDESYGVLEYKVYMFDKELEMLTSIFKLIHSLKRDFCLVWNASFDIPYLIDRFYSLTGDADKAADVICSPDFPTQTLYFHEDRHNFEFDKRRDYFDLSDYTHYLDQLILYAGTRKSQGAIRSVALGKVGQKELGDTKLDYSDVGNFIEFSYIDYIRYYIYNVKDVLLQMGIDKKTGDVESYYHSTYGNRCSYKDGLKQTVSLRAHFYDEFMKKGLILGHNVNFDNESTKEKTFSGAINGDPMLNDFTGLMLYGKRSMFLFGHSIDFDFSAMYPNSICAFNIFATSMIGKLYIENGENYTRYDKDPGKEFCEDMISQNILWLGEKWFGLPSLEELILEAMPYITGQKQYISNRDMNMAA